MHGLGKAKAEEDTAMEKVRLHISAEGNKPNATVKRQLGKLNIGLYCTKCGEFFALAVSEPKDDPKMEQVEIISDGQPLYECPFCHHQQRRQVSEIAKLRLTENNKQKPPPSKAAH
jgi:hypothetical protein